MTTLTFTHGIVSHSTTTGFPNGSQNFLVINGNKVDIHAPLDQSLLVTFAQRDTNYLITLQLGVNIQAWGYGTTAQFNQVMDNISGGGLSKNIWYLYINIDRVTGQTTYGHSIYDPTVGSSPPFASSPSSRPDDQHWFDTVDNTMKVWRASGVGPLYGKWVEVVRVFVTRYAYSSSFRSMSNNAPSFVGTTVGLTGSYRVGALIYDVIGNPLIRTTSNNENVFFTTEDIFTSGLPATSSPVSGNRARYETFLVDAIGIQPASEYSIVRFTDFNKVTPLVAASQGSVLWGMIEFPIGASGDLVQVTMSGIVRNPNWNWSIVGQQIYVDKNQPGILVTVEDDGYEPLPNQLPVAFALEKTAVLIRRPEIALSSIGGGVTDHGQLTGLLDDDHTQYFNITRANTWFQTKLIENLSNVSSGSPTADPGDVLTYDGFRWEPSPSTGGSGTYQGSPVPAHTHTFNDITGGSPEPLQSGDNISELVNDAGYLTSWGSPVPSHTHTYNDITGGSPEPLQPGDNISELVNDVGYVTSLGSPVTIPAHTHSSFQFPYDLTFFIAGTPLADTVVGSVLVPRDVSINSSGGSPFTVGRAYAETPVSSTTTVFNIFKNNGSPAIGTVTFTTGSPSVGVVNIDNDVTLLAGDRLKISTSSTVDTLIAGISIVIVGCTNIEQC